MESKDEALKSQIAAIRCAKAAMLLASLKSSPNRHPAHSGDKDEQKREKVEREIQRLQMELAREREKSKRIKLCALMEVVLQVMVVFSVSTLLLVLFFKSGSY